MRFITFIIMALLWAGFAVPCALADSNRVLNANETRLFVESLGATVDLAKRMESTGKARPIAATQSDAGDGSFNVYTENMKKFKTEYPDEYTEFTAIVKRYGFDTAEGWASVGDAVVMAFLAGQDSMQEIAADMKENMTPEALAAMPPNVRAQTQTAMAMMEAMENIPAENITTVQPYAEKIESYTSALQAK